MANDPLGEWLEWPERAADRAFRRTSDGSLVFLWGFRSRGYVVTDSRTEQALRAFSRRRSVAGLLFSLAAVLILGLVPCPLTLLSLAISYVALSVAVHLRSRMLTLGLSSMSRTETLMASSAAGRRPNFAALLVGEIIALSLAAFFVVLFVFQWLNASHWMNLSLYSILALLCGWFAWSFGEVIHVELKIRQLN
jgi:hypothetical protein